MQICCTKKLQDELGINVQNGSEENDLFCWSAHLITANRRKAIVVVNESNRIGFVLYGLKRFRDIVHALDAGGITFRSDQHKIVVVRNIK